MTGKTNAHMAAITKDKQGGKIVLAAGLMLAYTIISVCIRLHTRWPWKKMFRREDAVLLVATAISICYTATVALAVDNGLGTRETPQTAVSTRVSMVERYLAISFVLFFLTEGIATISYGLFLVSLAQDNSAHRLALKVGCYLEAIFTIVAVIVSSVYAARRESLAFSVWIAFGAIHAFVLVLLFGAIASMLLMSSMQVWKKVRAIFWFSLSLALVGAIASRLVFTPNDTFEAGFTIDTIPLLITMIVEMHFHLINATYPNLLVFVDKSTTGFIHGVPRSPSVYTMRDSDNSNSTQNRRSLSASQKLKFPSSRPSPDASRLESSASENEVVRSKTNSSDGDIQPG